jgi:hypothetical protein
LGAVANHAYWKALFDRLGSHKAIVAIARKLLAVAWHVLAEQVADREAVPEEVAGKFLEWSWEVGRAYGRSLTTVAFIRRQLLQVHIGDTLTTVFRGAKTLRLPPPEALAQSVS